MADERQKLDVNNKWVAAGVTNDANLDITMLRVDPTTKRLLVDANLSSDAIPASGLTTALAVQIVDAAGDQITSFGGGTQYTEDAAAAANPIGTVPILVRADTPTTIASTDGDNVGQRGTNYGAAYVTLLDSSGNEVSVGGGTQYVEDAASAGGEKLTLAGVVRQDTIASSTSTDGDYAYLKVNSVGRLYTSATVDAALPAGTNAIGKLAANDGVDVGDVTINNASGASAVNIQDGGNNISIDDGGNVITIDGSGSAGTAAAGVVTIQGIASMTPVQIGDNSSSISIDWNGTQPVTGSGNATGALRVELANNGTGLVGLNAGTNAIGKLAANSGVDIGDVDVTSVAGIQANLSTANSMTITLASLANSSAGVGRQSTLIDNTTNLYRGAKVHCKITVGTSPTANTLLYVYLIQSDGTIRDDAAGASDAGLTIKNAPLLGTILVPATTSDTAYYGIFDTANIVSQLGREWGIAVVNNSGVTLNATAGNHSVSYVGYK